MRTDTVVIGAGQAGLAASWTLRDSGVEHVVLERGRVAESWRAQRWDSFCLNTPNRYSTLPGVSYEGGEPDGFFGRDEFVRDCADYVRAFDLPVRENVEVVRVRATDDGFEVSTAGGETIACRHLIVASGIANAPKVPDSAGALADSITQVHTAEYRSPGALPEGGVLVVGSGQSGVQIAEDLVEAGRDTWLSTSLVGRLPRRYRGRDLFDWMATAGMLQHTIADLENPAEAKATQPQISGTMGGHSVSLASLARQGVKLLGGLERADGTVVYVRGNLLENAAFGDAFRDRITGMIDQGIEQAAAPAPPAEVDPADAPFHGLAEMAERRSLDLGSEGIRTVIWATGFTANFSWLELGALDDAGMPVHDGGVSEVPGLYFLGFPWLRVRGSGLICGVGDDARHVVAHLTAR